jgi:methionine-rich copper-binding protein CopC
MKIRQIATTLLLTGAAVVATATPAFAHAELISSNPAQGASVAAPPQQVQLTFSEAVTLPDNPFTITGPDGASWTVDTPSIAGAVITIPVQPSGPAGAYTLTYKVTADDGDTETGTVAFTLTTAAGTTSATTTTTEAAPTTTATASVANTSDSDSGIPVWVWILGAVILVAIGVVVALRLGRPKQS